MSLRTRKRKRNCANSILETLHKISHHPEIFWTEKDFYHTIAAMKFHDIQKRNSKYSAIELNRAASLLLANRHISIINTGDPINRENDSTKPELILTIEGQEALLDNYYYIENRKDFLEWFELKTKWVIPVVTLFLSAAAFSFSIYIFLHPHK